MARLPMTVRNVVLTLPCLACAACRVDVEDACVPSTCLHNCAACNSYFLRRLLCGRPSDWAFPGVTAVGSAHWRTSIRSSVLTACATPLLRPRPQSPQQAPQETAHYLRSSFRTLATAPPSLRLSSTFAPIVDARSSRSLQPFISPLPPCFIHHRPSPSDARPAVSTACPAQPSFNCFPRPPASIAVLIDNPTFTFAAPRHTRTVAHSIPTTPRGLADRCGLLHDAASSRDGLGC